MLGAVIVTPSGRRMSAGAFARAWKSVLASYRDNPASEVTGWQWFSCSAADAIADIRRGLDDRINRRGGLSVPHDDDALAGLEGATLAQVRRDHQRALDYRRNRIVCRGSGLETALARRLYPDAHAAFTARD